jgi:hypothetical protein
MPRALSAADAQSVGPHSSKTTDKLIVLWPCTHVLAGWIIVEYALHDVSSVVY